MSLIVWGLTIIVSLKYVTLMLRADNRGEGGIMALDGAGPDLGRQGVALVFSADGDGVFGATMFYGDSVITPAISVLSRDRRAGSGHARLLKPYVVPLTIVVLIALYALQSRGTRRHRPAGSARSCWSGSPRWR